MTRYVLDASVVIKWLQPERESEPNVDQALDLLLAYRRGEVDLLQPVHWIAEAAAVLARISPAVAQQDLMDLVNFEVPVADSPEIYRTALDLAIQLDHHLFDTLYHAVAFHAEDRQLITSDTRYFKKARSRGRILWLGDLKLQQA